MKKIIYTTSISIFLILNFTLKAQTWVKQTCNTQRDLVDLFFLNADTGWVTGDLGVVFKTTDGGQNWSEKSLIYHYDIRTCFFVDKNVGWIGGDYGVFKTTNGGDSWKPQINPINIYKIYFYDQSSGCAVGGSGTGSIYVTTDGGSNWTEIKNDSWTVLHGVQYINNLTIWAYYDKGLIKSKNGGWSWGSPKTFTPDFKINGMYFVDNNNGFIIGQTDTEGRIYKTTNGGSNWVNETPGLQYSPRYVKFFDTQNGIVFGESQSSLAVIMATSDGGETWSVQPTSSPVGTTRDDFTSVFSADINTLWAVGLSGSILKLKNTTDVAEKSNYSPHKFTLEQNYPNPFNPSTTISFQISSRSFVTLKVYNAVGDEVAVLLNEQKSPGSYKVNFNAGNLSSGIYFYKLAAGNLFQTKKLVILK